MRIDFWTILVLVGFVFLLYKLLPKLKVWKAKHKKHEAHADHGHTPAKGHGHGAGDHDDHHGNPVIGFIVGILKLYYVSIPGVIFLWCVLIPWSCKKRQQYQQEAAGIYPTPNYMQFKVNADIVGTGLLSTYTVSAYGPEHRRFDSVFNDGMFFDWNPINGEGTCGYYGGGTGKLKVESFTKPTPLSFLVMAKRQKQGNPDEWEEVKIEGKGSL